MTSNVGLGSSINSIAGIGLDQVRAPRSQPRPQVSIVFAPWPWHWTFLSQGNAGTATLNEAAKLRFILKSSILFLYAPKHLTIFLERQVLLKKSFEVAGIEPTTSQSSSNSTEYWLRYYPKPDSQVEFTGLVPSKVGLNSFLLSLWDCLWILFFFL